MIHWLIFVLGGLLFAAIDGITENVNVGKASPNQGIKLSLTLLIYGLQLGLIVGLCRGGSAVIKHYA